MSKTLSTHQRKQKLRQELAKNGGLIRVSFTFGGKEYLQTHRLTQSEMNEQMRLLTEHGAEAFDSATLKMTIWGASVLGRHAVEEAFKEYARKNWVPPENSITTQEVVDVLVERRKVLELGNESEEVEFTEMSVDVENPVEPTVNYGGTSE